MAPTTKLVGRDAELAELASLVGRRRLVTLTGPGGVGKTALARAVMSTSTVAQRVFVDLGTLDRSDGVESRIASALGQTRFDEIGPHRVPDDVLVVIDNCEHVLDATAMAVAELRTLLPDAAICATSRVPLGLRDETVYPLGPLRVPPRRVPDPGASAVELFRVVAERAGGRVTDDDLLAIGDLCRRIDGVPLAIEVAATRTRSLSVSEILDRLGDRLDTVAQGGFRRDDRQRSVRDTVEWSYHLLEPEDRELFDRLGVVAGRFSVGIAHGVAGDAWIEDTLDRLDRLVAASLVVAERGSDGATWYRQLHSVRACAREHLAAGGELDATSERFVDHIVTEARALADRTAHLWEPETIAMTDALPDSVIHAVRWAIDHDESPVRAFELLAVPWGPAHSDELLAVARRVIERWPDPTEPMWADAVATAATCLWATGRPEEAAALIDGALPHADGSKLAAVLLRRTHGLLLRESGDVDGAITTLADAADRARHQGRAALEVEAELLRANAMAAVGDVEGARSITGLIRERAEGAGITELLALCVEADALVPTDPETAMALCGRGFELVDHTGYPAASVGLGVTAATALVLLGDLPRAAAHLRDAADAMTAAGTMTQIGSVLESAALVAHHAGRDEWVDLAIAAAEIPSRTHYPTAASHVLPRLPHRAVPGPDLTAALATASQVVDAVLTGAPLPDDVAEPEAERPRRAGPDGVRSVARWRRLGDLWELSFEGVSATARSSKGLEDLATLLASPGVEVAAIDLVGAAVTSADTGEMIDAAARRQYEERIRELQSDLVAAEDDNDLGRIDVITQEMDALVEHLTSAVGIGRRTRRSGATTERARTAVTRRIRNAIAHVLELHPELGRHLDASVRTGTYCVYRPERVIAWEIERGPTRHR